VTGGLDERCPDCGGSVAFTVCSGHRSDRWEDAYYEADLDYGHADGEDGGEDEW